MPSGSGKPRVRSAARASATRWRAYSSVIETASQPALAARFNESFERAAAEGTDLGAM
ncbi:MAG: hypothetical protein QM756_44955 [Polyangiaceae bacterium]